MEFFKRRVIWNGSFSVIDNLVIFKKKIFMCEIKYRWDYFLKGGY